MITLHHQRHSCRILTSALAFAAPRVRKLIAAVVALGLVFPTSAEAGITFFTDRYAWENAVGTPSFTENFFGFPVDAPFQSFPVALNRMVIQQEGTERMAWNEVDVPPFQFTPNSGNNSGLLLTNFPEDGSVGIQVRITFTDLNRAFGFESWSGNDGEGAILDVLSGTALLGSQALTGGSGDFLGYVLTEVDPSTVIRFRSNRLTPGIVGERFYIDNLAGVALITSPGDYNVDGKVDAADYVVWRSRLGATHTQTEYDVWRAHFGQARSAGWSAGSGAVDPLSRLPASVQQLSAAVPETASVALLLTGIAAMALTTLLLPKQVCRTKSTARWAHR